MKIKSKHIAQFMLAYAIVAFASCIPFLFQLTDRVNFICILLVLILMLVVIVAMFYILKLENKELKTKEDLEIKDKLTILYYELNVAENELQCFSKVAMDSGEENWLKDQQRYIEYLKQEIETLKVKI